MESAADRSRILDPSLHPEGSLAIAWARRHSPVLTGLVASTFEDSSLEGVRVAVVVHLEAKTALLASVLADAGAEVVVAGSNPHSTRDEIAAALVERGIEVHATRGSDYGTWEKDLLAVADREPMYIVDDGAELTIRIARQRPDLYRRLRGVSEETTTGVERLRRLEAEGNLPFPAMAANDAACKHLFDNRYGTGQSTVQAVLQLTNFVMAGKEVAVVGYGWVGRGIATYVRAMGGRVSVIEVDPVKGLEALMEGHEVGSAASVLPTADIVITATGGMRAIGMRDFPHLKPNVVLANAGHHDLEIDVAALEEQAGAPRQVRPGVDRYEWNGKPINVLSKGALVNIAGGLGHPIEIMDLSFSVQGLSLHELVVNDLEPGVHILPKPLDDAIARARLEAEGVHLDSLSSEQVDDMGDWIGGR